jgi:hypothetical protein
VLKFGDSKIPRTRFAGRGPTVAPQKDYVPNRSGRKPPFHAEIEVASNLSDDSGYQSLYSTRLLIGRYLERRLYYAELCRKSSCPS